MTLPSKSSLINKLAPRQKSGIARKRQKAGIKRFIKVLLPFCVRMILPPTVVAEPGQNIVPAGVTKATKEIILIIILL